MALFAVLWHSSGTVALHTMATDSSLAKLELEVIAAKEKLDLKWQADGNHFCFVFAAEHPCMPQLGRLVSLNPSLRLLRD